MKQLTREINYTVSNSVLFTTDTSPAYTIQAMYPEYLVAGVGGKIGKYKSFKKAREAILASLEN